MILAAFILLSLLSIAGPYREGAEERVAVRYKDRWCRREV